MQCVTCVLESTGIYGIPSKERVIYSADFHLRHPSRWKGLKECKIYEWRDGS